MHFAVESLTQTLKNSAILMLAISGAWVAGPGYAAPNPATENRPALEMQNLQRNLDRARREKAVKEMRAKEKLTDEIAPVAAEMPESGLRFTLKTLKHTPSLVLTEDEFDEAVAPWIGKEIGTNDLAEILNAVNRLYADKGYAVCLAAVEPQRISDGELTITLVEGRTNDVTIEGNLTTKEAWLKDVLPLKQGEVVNYRDMLDRLVRFNMTNDVSMKVDMRAGSYPKTTDYRVVVEEPPRWNTVLFADTFGSESTGRYRAGASITNRSLFGIRDSASILAMASEGNLSTMLSYGVPLTPFGTRLSLTASYGEVEMVDGPSEALDIDGESMLFSAKIEHPFKVDNRQRWTGWLEMSRQTSETTMRGSFSLADLEIDAYRLGLTGVYLGEKSVYTLTTAVSEHRSTEKNFSNRKADYELWTGEAQGRFYFDTGISLLLSGRWQYLMGGDSISADYFYLGTSTGVRGYENDLLTAASGLILSAEATIPFRDRQSFFVFMDAGQLGNDGDSVSSDRSIWSAGAGLNWNIKERADVRLTLAIPLEKGLDTQEDVDDVRLDAMATFTF